ncbi:MAG: 3-dehydroquinate synthase [Steroidobacteraceae bacterium]|nr:3-dehydroquinate synthase [Steroidobacteraceae bacterium]
MQQLNVELGERSYPILIGHGLLAQPSRVAPLVGTRDVAIVTNTVVGPLYLDALREAIDRSASRRVVEIVLPDGEVHKTLDSISRILDVLVTNRLGRDATVVALGGGVVGDMAGFAAACYQRGVDFVQVPTTLLAQVDSSVGGKTGVNHAGGKNLIGAFHQPRAVITDTATLATLPDRELRAGLAEVIKSALICDAEFFGWLEQNVAPLLQRDPEALSTAIRRSCEIKSTIVGRDEREQGDRALLNLGHTFAHAIETATGYSTWLHGEAVGAGLMMAATMSQRAGWLDATAVERIALILQAIGLPTAAREVAGATALDLMRIDKKVKAGRMRFVLLQGIGHAVVTGDYPEAALGATLAAHFA